MKKSAFFYGLLIVMVIIAIISARLTINKMELKGQVIDQAFYELSMDYKALIQWLHLQSEDAKYSSFSRTELHQIDLAANSLGSISESEPITYQDFIEVRQGMQMLDVLIEPYDSIFSGETKKNILERTRNILKAKKEYNNKVMVYNSYIKQFPRNFYSSFFHFQAKDYLIIPMVEQAQD